MDQVHKVSNSKRILFRPTLVIHVRRREEIFGPLATALLVSKRTKFILKYGEVCKGFFKQLKFFF